MLFLKLPFKLGLLALAALSAGLLWQEAQLGVLALGRIDPVPEVRAMVADKRYAEAADYLGFFLDYDYVREDPAAQALDTEIRTVRESPAYQAEKLAEGLVNGSSDETIGQVAGVATDFFVIGDIRDLSRQATRWAQGEEVDEVVAALAAIGLAASAAQALSGAATLGTAGAAAPTLAASTAAKGGVAVLKGARKLGKLPPWLGEAMVDGARTIRRTGKLDAVGGLLDDVYRLAKTRGGLTLLAKTTDAASLRRMARVADAFGDRAAALNRIGGEAFLKTADRVGDLGVDNIRLAATYGQGGLKALDKVGALRFAKYSARGAKMVHKGDLAQLLVRLLARLPHWLLYLVIALAGILWMPWRLVGRWRQRRVAALRLPTPSGAPPAVLSSRVLVITHSSE